MKELTIGIIGLVVIVAAAGGYYLYEQRDLNTLKEGDFIEIYYSGYFDNNTVFSSSFAQQVPYDTPFDNNAYNLTPLKIYMGEKTPTKFPEGWTYGDIGSIEDENVYQIPGLFESLDGMKKGDEKTISLSADEAFGLAITNGTQFITAGIFGFNTTFEIVSIGGVTVDVKWIPEIGQIITMPQYWYDIPVQDPHWLWENATEVTAIDDNNLTLKTTPNILNNLTLYPWWENQSTATYNDTSIDIITTPTEENFTIDYMGMVIYGKVLNITDNNIKIEYTYGNQTIDDQLNRTFSFNRSINMPNLFEDVQKAYVEEDLQKDGFSFNRLAGNNVTFRVKLLKIYRV